jgi:DNA-binding protein HU-beta
MQRKHSKYALLEYHQRSDTMNRTDTIVQITRTTGITKTQGKHVIDALEARIKMHSDAGERVMLRGLGSFSKGAPAQKAGRNPRTGQPLTYTIYHHVTGAPSCSESKLCEEISADTALNPNAAKRAMDAFKGSLASALKKGDMLTLTGFGSFYVGKRAARIGRNPSTGAELRIAAARVPKFRAGKALKEAVN